jgi:hypothetical protein
MAARAISLGLVIWRHSWAEAGDAHKPSMPRVPRAPTPSCAFTGGRFSVDALVPPPGAS